MGKHYRVIVEVLTPDEDGDLTGKTVLELMGAGDMLGRFAPGAVAETLGAERAAVTVVMPQDAPEPATGTAEGEPSKPRSRRTKAQRAADDAAQALGFRDAAHRAEAAQQSAPDPREPDPATPDGPVVEQQPAAPSSANFAAPEGSMPATAVSTVPGAAEGPAKPYNPFG